MLICLVALWIHATQVLAGLCVWQMIGGQRRVGAGDVARAILLGPAAIAVQMCLHALCQSRVDLNVVLLPWWVAAVLMVSSGHAPRLTVRRPTLLEAAASAAILLSVGALFVAGLGTPVYAGDAMNNYALPARLFAAHGGFTADALIRLADGGNMNYPPLVALNEALFFLADERLGAWTLQPFFALGYLAWCLLILEAFGGSRTAASLACLILLVAAPEPRSNASNGQADVRLVAAFLAIALETKSDSTPRHFGAAVCFAVAGALTKREGLIASAAVAAFIAYHGRTAGRSRHASVALLGILVVGSCAWPVFAHLTALPPEFALDTRPRVLAAAILRVPSMLVGLVEAGAAIDVQGFARWGFLWPVALGVTVPCLFRRGIARLWLLMAGHAVILAYVLSVYEVGLGARREWVLGSTSERMLLQLSVWPVLMLSSWLASIDSRQRSGQ